MGKRRTVIKCVVLTCCLGLLIGAGRANNAEAIEEREIPIYTVAEKRSVKASVHVMEEPDSGIRESNETGEEAIEYAGMDGQDLPSGETEAETEVSEPEPEDIGIDAADTGITEEGSGTGYTAEDSGTGYAAEDGEGESDTAVSDMESTDSTGWDGWMENDPAVSEYRGDSEYSDSGIYEVPESGVDESGYADTEGEYDSEVYESADSYADSNEQYGDTEYSEDTDNGWSDGYESAVSEPEIQDTEYEESGDGWSYYTTALITHYCNCGICCPVAGGTTASGVYPTSGHTVATGDEFPFGTEIMINGTVYVVEDRGVGNGCVDVFVDDHQLALNLGMFYADVYVRG